MKTSKKGSAMPKMPKVAAPKIPRPTAQPTSVSKKTPDVSAAPFMGPSLTSRAKPRKM